MFLLAFKHEIRLYEPFIFSSRKSRAIGGVGFQQSEIGDFCSQTLITSFLPNRTSLDTGLSTGAYPCFLLEEVKNG
jgi:hypothetical protein